MRNLIFLHLSIGSQVCSPKLKIRSTISDKSLTDNLLNAEINLSDRGSKQDLQKVDFNEKSNYENLNVSKDQ